jgi:hypothetical protein
MVRCHVRGGLAYHQAKVVIPDGAASELRPHRCWSSGSPFKKGRQKFNGGGLVEQIRGHGRRTLVGHAMRSVAF